MLHVGTAVRWQDTWLCCRYKIKIMFYVFKCKCLWIVYLHVVVFGASLGVSPLPRHGKQGCMGRIYRESRSTRDTFFTIVWFRHSGQLQKPSRCAGFDEGCHGPIWRPPCDTSVWGGQPLLWMAEIRRPHGEISAGEGSSLVWEGSSLVWEGSDHTETSRWEGTSRC